VSRMTVPARRGLLLFGLHPTTIPAHSIVAVKKTKILFIALKFLAKVIKIIDVSKFFPKIVHKYNIFQIYDF
jgi:hypothetical protein